MSIGSSSISTRPSRAIEPEKGIVPTGETSGVLSPAGMQTTKRSGYCLAILVRPFAKKSMPSKYASEN